MSHVPHLTRRAFLNQTLAQGAAAAAALAVSTPGRTARGGEFTGKIRKAVKWRMVETPGLSTLEKFRLLRRLGFDGIEVHMRDQIVVDELLRARDDTGLVIHGVLNSSSPEISPAVDLAKRLGATSVLVVSGRVNRDTSYDANYREWSGRLKTEAPYAQEHGIRLLVENVWNNFLLSPLEMARFIDEIGHPAVAVYFDVGNVVRYGWPEQWIRILGQRIGKLDIKDYSRTLEQNEGVRKGFQVEIGDGDVNYPAVRQALLELGFQGWATAEVPGGAEERLAALAARIDAALSL